MSFFDTPTGDELSLKIPNYFSTIFNTGIQIYQLDTPCKAGARSTLYILDRFLSDSMNFRIRDSRAAHVR